MKLCKKSKKPAKIRRNNIAFIKNIAIILSMPKGEKACNNFENWNRGLVQMEKKIEDFIGYIHIMKKASENTEISYRQDLLKMIRFLEGQGVETIKEITSVNLHSYMNVLETQNLATATISRKIASTKAFFLYLQDQKYIIENPASELKAPKIDKKIPAVLAIEEVLKLLEEPKRGSAKEIRDQAMLELLYATGIRVTELLTLTIDDVNLEESYIICKNKERILPLGEVVKIALQRYLDEARSELLGEGESVVCFVNCSGKPMSRQGFWKLLKYYANRAGLKSEITPHTLRHSYKAVSTDCVK
jgi:Site-specific recombinase XerD